MLVTPASRRWRAPRAGALKSRIRADIAADKEVTVVVVSAMGQDQVQDFRSKDTGEE